MARQQRSGQHRVNAFIAVDRLSDPEITGEAAQHIGVGWFEVGEFPNPFDHLAQRLFGGIVEVGVHAHRDKMAGGGDAREGKALAFVQDQPERAR